MSRTNRKSHRHNPEKCGCNPDSPMYGIRKIVKRKYDRHGMILSARDTGTMFGHDDITYEGMDND